MNNREHRKARRELIKMRQRRERTKESLSRYELLLMARGTPWARTLEGIWSTVHSANRKTRVISITQVQLWRDKRPIVDRRQPTDPHAQAPSTMAILAKHPDLVDEIADNERVIRPEAIATKRESDRQYAELEKRWRSGK